MGMDSCSIGDHDQVNEELKALQSEGGAEDGWLRFTGLDVQLAFDGQQLPEFAARWVDVDAETCGQGHRSWARGQTPLFGVQKDAFKIVQQIKHTADLGDEEEDGSRRSILTLTFPTLSMIALAFSRERLCEGICYSFLFLLAVQITTPTVLMPGCAW